MAFWNSTKLPTLPNHQQLTATEQRGILGELKLNKKDIKNLQTSLKSAKEDGGLLNRNRRLSLNKMAEIVRKHDPKLAQKLKTGFDSYHKKVKSDLDEKMAKNIEHSQLEESMKNKGKQAHGLEQSVEATKAKLEEEKLKGLNGPVEREDKHGKYHALERSGTSAIRVHEANKDENKRNNQWKDSTGDDHTTSARHALKSKQTTSIDDIKEQAKNLPDLPI